MSLDLADDKSILVQVMACGIRQQAITWAKVYPDLCLHMASLGHNELITTAHRFVWRLLLIHILNSLLLQLISYQIKQKRPQVSNIIWCHEKPKALLKSLPNLLRNEYITQNCIQHHFSNIPTIPIKGLLTNSLHSTVIPYVNSQKHISSPSDALAPQGSKSSEIMTILHQFISMYPVVVWKMLVL